MEVNPIYKLNSLMANLTISNDVVDRIKAAQDTNEELAARISSSLKNVKKGEDWAIRFDGWLCALSSEELKQ